MTATPRGDVTKPQFPFQEKAPTPLRLPLSYKPHQPPLRPVDRSRSPLPAVVAAATFLLRTSTSTYSLLPYAYSCGLTSSKPSMLAAAAAWLPLP